MTYTTGLAIGGQSEGFYYSPIPPKVWIACGAREASIPDCLGEITSDCSWDYRFVHIRDNWYISRTSD